MGSRLCRLCGVYLDDGEEEFVSFREDGGEIRILIVALNYEYAGPETELTCTKDAKAIFRMAKRGAVEDITVVTDKGGIGAANFPTRSFVLKSIQAVGSRCEEGDWFVWFFAGHGVNVPDYNGDESESGFDQAFVTPDKQGKLTEPAVLVDDEFAIALDTFVPAGVRILCICDCCHSGTICDIETFPYKHEIYQISAADDMQEAEDTGRGGLLTTVLRRSVRSLSLRHGKHEFSISSVVQECERRSAKLTDEQDVTFQWSGTDPSLMAWPLCFHWHKYVSQPLLKVNIHDYEEDGDTDEDTADSE